MTKKEIVREIAVEMNIDQTIVRKVVQSCLDRILETILTEGHIELRNFGVFESKLRAARKARNPKTNQEVLVPAKRVITFRAGKNVAKRARAAAPPKK